MILLGVVSGENGASAASGAGIVNLSLGLAGTGRAIGSGVGTINLSVATVGVGSGGAAGVGVGSISQLLGITGIGSGAAASAGAIGLNVSVSGGSNTGAVLTTMTLLNTSGTTQAVGTCTQMFGHPFKKGDIPSGQYPVFKTSGGTVIPYSISLNKKTWSDGSLEHATFILRLPVTIAGGGTLGVNIFAGGSAPGASSRALSDFASGGLDLNVFVTGQDNISGDWTSNLNQGVSAAFSDNYVFMDGDAGKVWKVRANFRQSSANHGQLEGWWYVQALNNSSSALGGIRYLCRVMQPLYNVSSPAPQYRSFSALKTRNGTTQIRDIAATLPAAKTFTWSGSGPVLNSPANGFEAGIGCKLSTTGTLPAGLDATTFYCIAPNNSNSFGVSLEFGSPSMGQAVTPTTAGTGTHTATMYPMVSQFGSLWTAESNGRYSYIQGGGSLASDSTILCQMNNVYWCETKCLAPYDFVTYGPTSNATIPYFIGTAGPILRGLGTTGERQEIAQIMGYYVRHVFNQAAVDEQAVRVIGLIGGHLPVALYDTTTRSIPVANNGTYSGMPTANNTFRWTGSNPSASGFTPPSNANVLSQGWSTVTSDHMPGFTYYPYLLTGEPQYKDMLAEYGNLGLYQGYSNSGTAVVNGSSNTIGSIRNGTINGVTRSGIFYGEDGLRTVAWGMRDFCVTAIANFENASYNTYFDDIRSDQFGGYAGYRSMLTATGPAYVTANGLWQEDIGNKSNMWNLGYFIGSVALYAGMSEDPAAITMLNYHVKWPAHIANTFSPYLVAHYRALTRQGAADDSLYIASDASLGFYAWNLSWASAGSLFTLVLQPTGCSLNNGDVFVWNDTGSDGSPPPTGMSGWTAYYVVNKSGSITGSTFQLSATLGGSAITLSNSSGAALVYGRPTVSPSTGTIDTFGYLANITATCNWANAVGATVDQTFLTNMMARITGTAGYVTQINDDAKYPMRKTYQ